MVTPTLNDLIDSVLETQTADARLFKVSDPVEFLERFVYDPEQGTLLKLEDEQKKAIRHLTQRHEDGTFKYSTLIYSAPKKSGKTTVAAGLVLWHAWQVDNGACYVIGNDLKQADSRLFRVIEYAVTHHPVMRRFARVVRYNITLDNNTRIEALPIDPQGEAGMHPTNVTFTEMWGAKGKKAELMWSEATLSPTRQGHSFKLIESYAGHTGESVILERLYDNAVRPEYLVDADHDLYANDATGTAAYWCTRRSMPWQRGAIADEYYASEEASKTPSEYRRLHHNEWASSTNIFVQPEWWHTCKKELTPYRGQPLILGLDAAVSGDTFSIVGVTRDNDVIEARFVRVYTPPVHGTLDFERIEQDLRSFIREYNVLCVVYDPYQLHDMATRVSRDMNVWFYAFNQTSPRLKSDKTLYDKIKTGQIAHEDHPDLTAHVLAANAKNDGDNKLRIIKRSNASKIDAAVALSMAAYQASQLNI